MTGLWRLSKFQLGPEATAGDAIAATVMWRGPQVAARPLDVIEFVEEDIGNAGGANRTVKLAGGTQVEGTMLGFTINVKTGWEPIFSGDGQLYYYNIENPGWEIMVDIVFKHVAGADTEHANWLAQTARLLELKLEGANLVTSGTEYEKFTTQRLRESSHH